MQKKEGKLRRDGGTELCSKLAWPANILTLYLVGNLATMPQALNLGVFLQKGGGGKASWADEEADAEGAGSRA